MTKDNPFEIPEKFDTEQWENDFRPNYNPDWGENGTIHLDGEWDWPLGLPSTEIIDDFQDRAEVIGGLCIHDSAAQKFAVTAQMGYLKYVIKYNDNDQVQSITLFENGKNIGTYEMDDLLEFAQEVAGPIKEFLESDAVTWEIKKDEGPKHIHEMVDDDGE